MICHQSMTSFEIKGSDHTIQGHSDSVCNVVFMGMGLLANVFAQRRGSAMIHSSFAGLELHVWRSQRVTPNGLKVIWRSGKATGSKSLTRNGTKRIPLIRKAPCAVALASPRKRWHSIHLNLYTLNIWWTYTCVNHGSVSPARYSHFHDMVILTGAVPLKRVPIPYWKFRTGRLNNLIWQFVDVNGWNIHCNWIN